MNSGTGIKTSHILLLEDDRAHQDLALRAFRDDPETFRVTVSANILDARQVIDRDPPDLIIADWILPDGKGLDILPRREGRVTIPLVIMTSFGDEHLAVEIMKSGAIDYVVKSATVFRDLPHIARRALREWEHIQERIRAEEAEQESRKRLADILGFLPDAMFAIDNDGRVIAWNNAIERMTGVVAKDMIGKGDHEYSIPFYGERRPILIDLVRMEDDEVGEKYDYIQRDGRKITSETFIPTLYGGKGAYLWGTALPLFDNAGNHIGAIEVIRDITERKMAEEALQMSEEKFRTMVEASPDIIWEIDKGGAFTYISSQSATTLGYSQEELIGKPFFSLIRPEAIPAIKPKFFAHIENKNAFRTLDVPAICRDGSPCTLEIRSVPILADGQLTGFRGIARDITERKRVEKELQVKEYQLSTIYRNTSEVLFFLSVEQNNRYRFLSVNQPFLDITGLPQEQILGKYVDEVIPEPSLTLVLEKYNQAIEGNSTVTWEEITEYPTGIKWGDVSVTPLIDATGRCTNLVGSVHDITERKLAEEKIRESEKKYRFLIDNVRDIVWQTTPDLTFTYLSPAAETLTGYPPGELIGTSLFGLLTEPSARVVREKLRKRMEEYSHGSRDLVTVIETEITQKIGGTRWLEVSANAVFGPGGSFEGFQGISRDITERKRTETALIESEERFRDLFNNMSAGVAIYEMTPDGKDFIIRDVNRAVERIEHVKKEEIVGKSVLAAFPGVVEFGLFDVFLRVATTGIAESHPSTMYRDKRVSGWRENYVYKLPSGEIVALYDDVTERKQAEERVRESEERYRNLSESSPDQIFIISRDDTLQYVNSRALKQFNLPLDQILGKPRTSLFPPETAMAQGVHLKEVFKTGTPQQEEETIRFGNVKLWIDTRFVPLKDEKGNVVSVLGVARDITESKLAETALRESETRFRALIQNSSDIIRILDRDGLIVYESPSSERILGYPPDHLIGKNPMDYIHPDDFEQVRNDFQDVLDKTNPGTPTEFRIRKADGEYIWVDAIATNLLEVPGVNGTVVTTRPIQQRKEAEQALRKNEARLATAMDIAHLVNWEFDVATGMFTFDDRFYTLYATTADREGGNLMSAETYMQEFVYPDDRPAVIASIQKILATTDPDYAGRMEHRITPRDGSVHTIIARFAPIMGPDGKVIRTYGANQDITDLKLMESEIRSLNTALEKRVRDRTEALAKTNEALEEEIAQRLAAEKKLQASFDEKVTLLKEIHHRVKNNLQIITSLLNLQSRYIKDKPSLEVIRESQNRIKAMALVHEKLYRTEDISHISLSDYIRFLGTGLFQFYDARSRGIRFTLDIRDINVDIDAAIPLGLIMNELISNSLKYAFPEGRKGEIAISVKKEGHTLTVVYRDTGIGIPADLDWRDTQSLGLRLVNTLVDQLNGTVELDRSAGTAFTMILHEKEQRGTQ